MINKIFASISGGKTSAYMAKIIQESFSCPVKYVFANTGFEHEETLIFVDKLDKALNLDIVWVEADVKREGVGTKHKIVDFETASRWENWSNGSHPFVDVAKKYGVPHSGRPHCTRELKLSPMNSYINSVWPDKDYSVAIGIRADEAHRKAKGKNLLYPLIQMGVDKQEVNDFWEDQAFTLNIPESHGNCLGCFKKSFPKLKSVYESMPEAFEVTRHIENISRADMIINGEAKHGIQKIFRGWRNTTEIIHLFKHSDISETPQDPDIPSECTEECGINSALDGRDGDS